jgi:hypothetical protein
LTPCSGSGTQVSGPLPKRGGMGLCRPKKKHREAGGGRYRDWVGASGVGSAVVNAQRLPRRTTPRTALSLVKPETSPRTLFPARPWSTTVAARFFYHGALMADSTWVHESASGERWCSELGYFPCSLIPEDCLRGLVGTSGRVFLRLRRSMLIRGSYSHWPCERLG